MRLATQSNEAGDRVLAVTICGRAKDLIKSGGEWINPVEIEEIVSHHPGVGFAAVIGRFDYAAQKFTGKRASR